MLEELYKKSKKQTSITYIILCVLLVLIFLHHTFLSQDLTSAGFGFTMVCFMGTVIFAICFPIIFRLYYFKKVKEKKSLTKDEYIKFRQLILYSVALGTIFTLEGYFFMIYSNILTLSVLLILYGIYSIWPSKKTTRLELISMNVEGYNDHLKEEIKNEKKVDKRKK